MDALVAALRARVNPADPRFGEGASWSLAVSGAGCKVGPAEREVRRRRLLTEVPLPFAGSVALDEGRDVIKPRLILVHIERPYRHRK